MWRDDDDGGAVFEQAKALVAGGRLPGRTIDELVRTARAGALPGAHAATWTLGFAEIPARRLDELVRMLLDLLDDTELPVDVRAQAAEAVGDRLVATTRSTLRRVAVTRLTTRLRDPHPEIRFWSAFSLGKLDATRARQQLRALLSDESTVPGWWTVGEEASDALDRIQGREPPERSRPPDQGPEPR